MAADPTYPSVFQVRQDGNAVVPSGQSLDIESGGSLKIAGTAITATAAEMNKLAGVTAGTVTASKALVVDANSQLTGLRRPLLIKSADYTVTAADSGAIIVVTGVDKTMTLPATAAGMWFTFVLASAGLSAGTGLSISPNAADKIMGNGFTSADDKDAVLAGSGDREGDSISLIGDGVDGWYITGVTGTWTRQA